MKTIYLITYASFEGADDVLYQDVTVIEGKKEAEAVFKHICKNAFENAANPYDSDNENDYKPVSVTKGENSYRCTRLTDIFQAVVELKEIEC